MIEVGSEFGRLTVASVCGATAACQCVCGKLVHVRSHRLLNGHTKSCGCLRADTSRLKATSHGLRGHPLYAVWAQMRNRCNNPGCRDFPRYGARGIRVDPTWGSFERFVADVGDRPTTNHSLDRIDNDGPYAPGNVRWATSAEQAANSRKIRWLAAGGRTQSLSAWARELQMSVSNLHLKLKKDPEALTAIFGA